MSDEDFQYTWHWFQEVLGFYDRAARGGWSVVFTVDP
jgi:hypothetical protein